MIWLLIVLAFLMGYITCALLSVNTIIESSKQGTWKINSDGYYPYCSNCGYEPPYVSGKDMRTPYCSNCGAEMDGRREEAEKECEGK